MVWSIYPYENEYVSENEVLVAGIPTLKFSPKDMKGLLPTVIFYHGWHSSSSFERFEAMAIAAQGYQVFVPDALHHGQRDPIDYDAPGVIEQKLWSIILQSVDESEDFIKAIVSDYQADPDRIAVMGTSMGAVTAGGIFAKLPQLKCLIGLIGTFAWSDAVQKHILPPMGAHEAGILASDPAGRLAELSERPILMCNGKADPIMPFDHQQYFYELLKPYYKQFPERLQLLGWDGLAHLTTMTMYQQATMWLKAYL